MTKYKYYFKKPKSEIVKDILKWLGICGAVYIAASSPYFTFNLIKNLERFRRYQRKKIYDTFYQLRKEGCIKVSYSYKKHQIHISLTEKGRQKANWFQIDSLEIKKPKRWDKKWRIVIFDIPQIQSLKRNVFRSKLKELGFYPLQKSVWLHPYKCQDEIKLLREFLGLNKKEVLLIEAGKIEGDNFLKKKINL